ncbi:MAG: hypothetical protein O7F16_12520 [Acidobacteria bacterium]|nr:hypothetical protein [Acidobacteriota bacterium]
MSEHPSVDLPDEPDYVAGVEARIAELRGAPLILSTRDWERVCTWRRQGIPLRVVQRALDDVLGSNEEGEEDGLHPPRSLAYCERAVQQRWKARREAWVGRANVSTSSPRRVRTVLNALARHIELAARNLKHGPHGGLAPPVRKLASTLRDLARQCASSAHPLDDLAPALGDAESSFHRELQASPESAWKDRQVSERKRLQKQLAGMSPGAADATVDAALLRQLRRELCVPGFDLGAVHARLQAGPARRRLTVPSKAV